LTPRTHDGDRWLIALTDKVRETGTIASQSGDVPALRASATISPQVPRPHGRGYRLPPLRGWLLRSSRLNWKLTLELLSVTR
jgi:hypothetical protein